MDKMLFILKAFCLSLFIVISRGQSFSTALPSTTHVNECHNEILSNATWHNCQCLGPRNISCYLSRITKMDKLLDILSSLNYTFLQSMSFSLDDTSNNRFKIRLKPLNMSRLRDFPELKVLNIFQSQYTNVIRQMK